MSDPTKSCNLTADEIECVMAMHGHNLSICASLKPNHDKYIERLNYLNKRLNAFNEPEKVEEIKSTPTAAGW